MIRRQLAYSPVCGDEEADHLVSGFAHPWQPTYLGQQLLLSPVGQCLFAIKTDRQLAVAEIHLSAQGNFIHVDRLRYRGFVRRQPSICQTRAAFLILCSPEGTAMSDGIDQHAETDRIVRGARS